MRKRVSLKTAGFTLVEILLSIAVIVLLAGLVYAGLAPVRERAREVYCLNNFRQIAKAVQMYREDYGGGEPPGALTAEQLGLPQHLRLLAPYVGGNWGVFQCPSEYWPESFRPSRIVDPRRTVSYMWHVILDNEPTPPPVKKFRDQVAVRGNDTPLATDPHHGTMYRGGGRSFRVIVLRLGGQVQTRYASWREASWQR